MQIYEPEEDSYLLSETFENYLINLLKKSINEKRKNNDKKMNKRTPVKISKKSLSKQEKPKHLQQKPKHLKLQINNIKNNNIKNIKILDMGSGSGIQAETCRKLRFKNILTCDINRKAVKFLRKKGFKSIKSNLFSNINKKQKFDIIIFNSPYLPEDKYDGKKDTTAGKKGYELIIRFLNQTKFHLNKNAVILLLFSSLSKPKIIKKIAKQLGYKIKLLNKQRIFFEELYVYELKL